MAVAISGPGSLAPAFGAAAGGGGAPGGSGNPLISIVNSRVKSYIPFNSVLSNTGRFIWAVNIVVNFDSGCALAKARAFEAGVGTGNLPGIRRARTAAGRSKVDASPLPAGGGGLHGRHFECYRSRALPEGECARENGGTGTERSWTKPHDRPPSRIL